MERKKEREKQELLRKRKKEIMHLEKLIGKNETNIKELDRILCKPEIYSEPDKAIQFSQEREELQLILDSLYNKWISLTDE